MWTKVHIHIPMRGIMKTITNATAYLGKRNKREAYNSNKPNPNIDDRAHPCRVLTHDHHIWEDHRT